MQVPSSIAISVFGGFWVVLSVSSGVMCSKFFWVFLDGFGWFSAGFRCSELVLSVASRFSKFQAGFGDSRLFLDVLISFWCSQKVCVFMSCFGRSCIQSSRKESSVDSTVQY